MLVTALCMACFSMAKINQKLRPYYFKMLPPYFECSGWNAGIYQHSRQDLVHKQKKSSLQKNQACKKTGHVPVWQTAEAVQQQYLSAYNCNMHQKYAYRHTFQISAAKTFFWKQEDKC